MATVHDFPYLQDKDFLKNFDLLKIKNQFIKIVALDFITEQPIDEIQGKVTGGSLTFDGSSAMRRTGSISLISTDLEKDIITTKNLLSINKKVEVLIGFKNTTKVEKYKAYDIIWFPMGVYVILSPNISHDSNGISISLTLHDKMALLNGECGGIIPASVILNECEDIDENGGIIISYPTIYQIIIQLVNHFGGEQLGRIIISDISNTIKKVVKWTGSSELYLYQKDGQNHYDTNPSEVMGVPTIFKYGEDIGYVMTDFIFPTDLISNAGDTVVSILDKIKNTLGNYEYFYDIDGNFRFQQIKNYLNTSYSTFEINTINANNYLVDYVGGKSVYTFDDSNLIVSYANSPQFDQIKNDFVVWGKKKSITGVELPIRYHLTIDKKPEIMQEVQENGQIVLKNKTYQVFFYTDPDDGIEKARRPMQFANIGEFPQKGQEGLFYYAANNSKIYRWDSLTERYIQTDYHLETVEVHDYRTELYMEGALREPHGLNSNYYFAELQNEWPKLYNMKGSNPDFRDEVKRNKSNIDFFLDFIDSSAAISEFSVSNIGRRTEVINEDSVNCIFEPQIPDIVIIETNSPNAQSIETECTAKGQEWVQVKPEIYSLLITGGTLRSAYEEIRQMIYQYTNYNEQVSITTIPIYHLEPNTRITIKDPEAGIDGDYMIKSISIPLDINGTMSISCTKALERI